jgi:hypothetical protein
VALSAGQHVAHHRAGEECDPMATDTRLPLARDLAGEPIPVPAAAAGWRVWRHTGGRPRAVVTPDREPVELPITAGLDDLAALGPGLYRLRPVTRDGQILGGVSVDHDVAGRPDEALAGRTARPSTASETVLATAVRMFEASHRSQQDTIRELTSMNRELVHKLGEIAATPSRLGGVSWKDFDDFEARKERAVTAELARRNASAAEADDDGDDRDKSLVEMLADKYGMVLINKAATAWEQYCARDKATPTPRHASAPAPSVPNTPAPASVSASPPPRPVAPSPMAPPAISVPVSMPSPMAPPALSVPVSMPSPVAPPPADEAPVAATVAAPTTTPSEAEPDDDTAAQIAALGVSPEILQELEQRIAEVEQHLTADERQIVEQVLALDDLPHDLMNEVARAVCMMDAPAAARYVREAGCLDRARRLVEAAGGAS